MRLTLHRAALGPTGRRGLQQMSRRGSAQHHSRRLQSTLPTARCAAPAPAAGSHDNVVALRGLCKHGSHHYLVMELCPR